MNEVILLSHFGYQRILVIFFLYRLECILKDKNVLLLIEEYNRKNKFIKYRLEIII